MTATAERAPVEGTGARPDRALLALVLFAAAVRALYWLVFLRHYTPLSDAAHYELIARNLASGDGFSHPFPALEPHPTAFRPPLFPLLLGAVYFVTWPAVGIAQLLNLVLGCAVVALTFLLVQDVAGRRAALFAGVLAAVYPPLVANDVVPLAESLALVLLLALGLAVRHGAYAWAGVLAGLLVLTRTSAQAVVLIVAVWIGVRLGVRRAAVTVVLAAVVVVPWVVRNDIQVGAPVLVTSNGFNLAAVHSQEAEDTGHFVDPVYDPRFEAFRLYQFDEVEWDRKLTEHAMDHIREDPLSVVSVMWRNVFGLFDLDPGLNDWPEEQDGRNHGFRTAMLPLYWAVSAVGLVGLWRTRRDPTVQFLAVLVAYFVVLSLVFVAPPRLRVPFDLLCVIGAGIVLSRLGAGRRRPGPAAPPTAGAGAG